MINECLKMINDCMKMIDQFCVGVFCFLPAVGFSTVAINYVFELTAKKKQVSPHLLRCLQGHSHRQENLISIESSLVRKPE